MPDMYARILVLHWFVLYEYCIAIYRTFIMRGHIARMPGIFTATFSPSLFYTGSKERERDTEAHDAGQLAGRPPFTHLRIYNHLPAPLTFLFPAVQVAGRTYINQSLTPWAAHRNYSLACYDVHPFRSGDSRAWTSLLTSSEGQDTVACCKGAHDDTSSRAVYIA